LAGQLRIKAIVVKASFGLKLLLAGKKLWDQSWVVRRIVMNSGGINHHFLNNNLEITGGW